jgi:hypothetical protein
VVHEGVGIVRVYLQRGVPFGCCCMCEVHGVLVVLRGRTLRMRHFGEHACNESLAFALMQPLETGPDVHAFPLLCVPVVPTWQLLHMSK